MQWSLSEKRSVDTAEHVHITFISKQFEVPRLTWVDPERFDCDFTFYIATEEDSSVWVDLKWPGPRQFGRKFAKNSPLIWWYWWLHRTRGRNPNPSVKSAFGSSINLKWEYQICNECSRMLWELDIIPPKQHFSLFWPFIAGGIL